MEDLKQIISHNIVMLRKDLGMTQIELAEKLNYSDKAISKWERGESIPDVTVLKAIADIFGVTVDYLLRDGHENEEKDPDRKHRDDIVRAEIARNHKMITAISVISVFIIASIIFIILNLTTNGTAHYLSLIYSPTVGTIVWLVFNSIWHNRRFNFVIISIMMWTVLFAIHMTSLCFGANLWHFYLVGIPGQIVIALCSLIGKKANVKK